MPGVVLVTGASSGIGEAIAEMLAARGGWTVIGTSRDLANVGSCRPFEFAQLDVRDAGSIARCCAEVAAHHGPIDVLVNCAGYALLGAAEESDDDEMRDVVETNFLGAVRMTNAVLPNMRARRHGRIINMGVVLGFLPQPFASLLVASKHALRGYTRSIAYELREFSIYPTIIEPGFVRTEQAGRLRRSRRMIEDYAPKRDRVTANFQRGMTRGIEPRRVATAVVRTLGERRPPWRTGIGAFSSLLPAMSAAPSLVLDSAIDRQMRG